jgi:hypothetical protein
MSKKLGAAAARPASVAKGGKTRNQIKAEIYIHTIREAL